jgi:transposase-like protein
MPETRRRCDREFREGAVRTVRRTGKPIAQVARDLWNDRAVWVTPMRAEVWRVRRDAASPAVRRPGRVLGQALVAASTRTRTQIWISRALNVADQGWRDEINSHYRLIVKAIESPVIIRGDRHASGPVRAAGEVFNKMSSDDVLRFASEPASRAKSR